jgi:hypothetical protein
LYAYAFNCAKRDFDLDGAVANFLAFSDEVVIATLATQEDDTLDRLRAHAAANPRLKVVVSDMDIKRNNRFDGDLKTLALQACTHPIRVIADADERFVISQRMWWDALGARLLEQPTIDGWLIPVIDLYGSKDTIRADQHVGLKMRIHKATVVKRGVHHLAERGAGLIDTSMSDTTDPLLADGSMARFAPVVNPSQLHPLMCNQLPVFVLHYGYLDLARRAKLGREFWKTHWEARSGHVENVAVDKASLEGYPVVPHGLKLT